MTQGTLFTVSAPSGAGKTSLVNALVGEDPNIVLSISHTTRPMRPGEQDDIDYHFVSHERFEAMAEGGEFLEHAKVFKNRYGTAKSLVEKKLEAGRDVLLEIDWQGAAQVRCKRPDCISIFVLPPSRETLEQRLKGRGQDTEEVIKERLAEAQHEMSHYLHADFVIINDDFQQALQELKAIIQSCRVRRERQVLTHQLLIDGLLEGYVSPEETMLAESAAAQQAAEEQGVLDEAELSVAVAADLPLADAETAAELDAETVVEPAVAKTLESQIPEEIEPISADNSFPEEIEPTASLKEDIEEDVIAAVPAPSAISAEAEVVSELSAKQIPLEERDVNDLDDDELSDIFTEEELGLTGNYSDHN